MLFKMAQGNIFMPCQQKEANGGAATDKRVQYSEKSLCFCLKNGFKLRLDLEAAYVEE